MQIARIYYPVKTLGPGHRIGIWTIGCNRRCNRCSNPELWEPDPEKDVALATIQDTLLRIKSCSHIDGITISGGEPFLNPEELCGLVLFLKRGVSEDILVYTGYTIDELYRSNNPHTIAVLENIAVLIDGPYVNHLNDNTGLRGSSNQKIIFIDPEYKQKYENAVSGKRLVQNIHYNSGFVSFGIPVKNYKESLSAQLRQRGISYE
ncbi:MAG: radical SAM protein [Deltaproteobacteria bacterium]|nr:radical SAM protein [Deltaproteobacteria bacterium]